MEEELMNNQSSQSRFCAVLLTGLAAALFSADAFSQSADGPGFVVAQRFPQDGAPNGPVVARGATGNFVIVWNNAAGDESAPPPGLFARTYGPDGTSLTSEFRVSTGPADIDSYSVAMNDSGGFVVAWVADSRIYVQRFGIDGAANGDPIQVASPLTHSTLAARVVMDAEGDFTVAWGQWSQLVQQGQNGPVTINFQSIRARIYNSDGTPRTSAFAVQTSIPVFGVKAINFAPRMAVDAAGDLVFVWLSELGQNQIVYGRQFKPDGTAVGNAFRISEQGLLANHPTVSCDNVGNFVVAWYGNPTPAPVVTENIYARLFAADGSARASSFLVWQSQPIGPDTVFIPPLPDNVEVAMYPTTSGPFDHNYIANFVVVWTTHNFDAGRTEEQFFGKYFMDFPDFGPTDAFEIEGSDFERLGGIAVDASGDLVVTWGSGFNYATISARLYSP